MMRTRKYLKMPYGVSDFGRIRSEVVCKFCLVLAFGIAVTASARDLIWVGGAEGADANKWDLTTLNWRVAGDETMTPVAFEAGDNVLFDDTAQSFYVVMEKVDAVNTYQYDIGNVVFSNEVNNYGWKCFTDTWTEARGHMGTIDKWGAGILTIQTRLDTPKDFTCHEGKIISDAGSWWISEYRSTLGSLHDARKITFMPGTSLQVDHDALLGGPGTAGRVNALFNGVDVLLRYKQCFNTVTFSNCPSFYANSGPILVYGTLYLRGHGLAPHVFAGAGCDLTFQSSLTPTSTIYVDDLTGDGVTVDDKDDLIVSNKLGTVNANGNNGSSFRGNSSFRKAGKGTMVLSNSSYSSATGDIVVVEGKLVMNGVPAGLSMTGSNWMNAAFGAVAGTRTRTVTVQSDAELEFRRSSTTGPYNTPQEWRLVVDGGTLTLANRATTGFGTLELNNATFNYALGEGSGWFPSWGLFSVAQKLAFKGSTPYDLVQTPYSDWRDCPYITLGFTLSSPRDDEPIDPSKPMLTNLWNVVDFEVDDITGDSGTDATIRLPIRDMVNMSYTDYNNPKINSYTYNPWQWCRFRGGIRKTGAGTLCLNGTISYTHTTEVAGGALLVDSSIATSSGVTVDSGAWLGGTGTVSAVTVRDGGGFICYAGRNAAKTLRVPSLTAEGDVVVRVANPDNLDKSAFRQDIVTLTAKPASVNLRNWHISYEGDEAAKAFGFGYDPSTGVVRAWYSGGTMMIFR